MVGAGQAGAAISSVTIAGFVLTGWDGSKWSGLNWGSAGTATVEDATGSLAAALGATTADDSLTLTSWSFSDDPAGVIWATDSNHGAFEFNLQSFTVDTNEEDLLEISGIGSLGGLNVDFSFTYDVVEIGSFKPGGVFVVETSQVPLPAAVWLYGTALFGIAAFVRGTGDRKTKDAAVVR